jgi:EmrB/QacA subfamily drug resistance transporter
VIARGTTTAHPNWTLVACILASSLAFIDGSVTNVALPAIGHALDATPAELQWTINAYMLPLAALLLLGGAMGDHFGRKKLLIAGIALFAFASIACGLAQSLPMLLAARAAQGVGAAILLPNSLALLNAAFEGGTRGRAVGTWAAAGAAAAAFGPPLGGWLVDRFGWEAIFFVNVPVAALAVAIAWRFAAESAERGQPLDWIGAVLATLALGVVSWALTIWSSHARLTPGPAIGLGVGVLLALLFVHHQRKLGSSAMMPLALFGSRAFAGLSLLTFLVYGALGGLLVLLPYVLIRACGYSALHAGFALLPFPLVMGLTGRAMGRLADQVGVRWPLTLGPAATALGLALLLRVEPGASYWISVFPALLVVALGMAGTAAPLTTAVLSSVDDHHAGTASGFNSAVSRAGGLVATATAGGVIASAGDALVGSFHWAAIVGAVLTASAAAIALSTLGENRS